MAIGTDTGEYHESELDRVIASVSPRSHRGATEEPAGEFKSSGGTEVAGGERWDRIQAPTIAPNFQWPKGTHGGSPHLDPIPGQDMQIPQGPGGPYVPIMPRQWGQKLSEVRDMEAGDKPKGKYPKGWEPDFEADSWDEFAKHPRGTDWEEIRHMDPDNPGVMKGGVGWKVRSKPPLTSQTDEQPDEVKAGQKYAMEKGRLPLSDVAPKGGGGGVTPPAEKTGQLKLERIRADPSSQPSSQHNYKMMYDNQHIGGMSLTPEKWGDKQILYMNFVGAKPKGTTVAERAQGALQFRKALQEQYPDAVGTYGYRISGVKQGKSNPYQFVPLKDEYSGKDIRAIIEEVAPNWFWLRH